MRDGANTRFRLILLLPLLMLLAQQGAWLHQLSHATYSAQHQVLAQQAGSGLDNDRCPACHSFSQVFFAASAQPPQLAFLAPPILRGPEWRFTVVAVDAPVPRSRGPPSV